MCAVPVYGKENDGLRRTCRLWRVRVRPCRREGNGDTSAFSRSLTEKRSIARILDIHLTLPLILTTTILCETPHLTLPNVPSSLYDVRILLFRNFVELMVKDFRHWSLSHTASKILFRIFFSNIFISFSTDLHIVQVSEV